MWFVVNDDAPVKTGQRVDDQGVRYQTVGNSAWFTNLDHSKRHEELVLYKTYNPVDYPSYDNYDAIEVGDVVNIPKDYDGVMGVPITFLGKHNLDQFEIVGIAKAPMGKPSKVYPRQIQVSKNGVKSTVTKLNDGPALKVDKPPVGKNYYEVDGETYVQLFARILIRRKDR
jgi:Adenine-specific methyltransferase EcoRI